MVHTRLIPSASLESQSRRFILHTSTSANHADCGGCLHAEALTGALNLDYGDWKYFILSGATCITYTVESSDNSLGFNSWCVVRSPSPLELPSPRYALKGDGVKPKS